MASSSCVVGCASFSTSPQKAVFTSGELLSEHLEGRCPQARGGGGSDGIEAASTYCFGPVLVCPSSSRVHRVKGQTIAARSEKDWARLAVLCVVRRQEFGAPTTRHHWLLAAAPLAAAASADSFSLSSPRAIFRVALTRSQLVTHTARMRSSHFICGAGSKRKAAMVAASSHHGAVPDRHSRRRRHHHSQPRPASARRPRPSHEEQSADGGVVGVTAS